MFSESGDAVHRRTGGLENVNAMHRQNDGGCCSPPHRRLRKTTNLQVALSFTTCSPPHRRLRKSIAARGSPVAPDRSPPHRRLRKCSCLRSGPAPDTVHRRTGGLETVNLAHSRRRIVHRRTGGLENGFHVSLALRVVHRRTGGLENLSCYRYH